MNLRDEIREAKGQAYNSEKWTDIHQCLLQLAEQHGGSATGPWVVVWTAFHGGGLVSRHRTATRAIERARREGPADCTCGCTCVLPAAEYGDLPQAAECQHPYSAAC